MSTQSSTTTELQPAAVPAVALGSLSPVRVKDVATLQGVQPVPLVGYGLVIGLNKSGDKRQTIFSTQTLANMLERFGVVVSADQVKVENIAAVLVTRSCPRLPSRARASTSPRHRSAMRAVCREVR